jgi:amino acid transporter
MADAAALNPSAAAAEAGDVTDLKQAITLPRMLLFILGDVLGAGVYVLIGQVAGTVGGAVWAPFVLALVFALLTAFSYAELVTKYPKAGGASVFVQRAFGNPLLSFVTGFAMFSAAVAAAASLAAAFAGDYLAEFITVPSTLAAIVFLVLVALLNLRGIDESMRVNVVLTVIEVGGLLLVIVLGFLTVTGGGGNPEQATRSSRPRPRSRSRSWAARCWPTMRSSASRPPRTWPRRPSTRAAPTPSRCSGP